MVQLILSVVIFLILGLVLLAICKKIEYYNVRIVSAGTDYRSHCFKTCREYWYSALAMWLIALAVLVGVMVF